MKNYPALALIEFSSISTGILAGDAMIKKAPISLYKSGTVSRGKYLVLIAGTVASVGMSFNEGLEIGKDLIVDKVLLPDVHPNVIETILGDRNQITDESFGIIETASVAGMIEAADAGIKGASVKIVEIRLADALGGKAFVMFNGKVEDIEAALEIGTNAISNKALWRNKSIIPSIHDELANEINETTRFANAEFREIPGGE